MTIVPVDRETFDEIMAAARKIVSIQASPEGHSKCAVTFAAAGIWFQMRHVLRKAGMLEESEEARAYAMSADSAAPGISRERLAMQSLRRLREEVLSGPFAIDATEQSPPVAAGRISLTATFDQYGRPLTWETEHTAHG